MENSFFNKKWIFVIIAFLILIWLIGGSDSEIPEVQIGDPIPTIRSAAVAGDWYPADAVELKAQIEQYLSQAPSIATKKKPRVIIVPHPGLDYGGATAAYAYKTIAPFHYDNIYLIGVSHTGSFDGISFGDFNYYETPLGKIKVNRDVTSYLRKKSLRFKFIPEAHEKEHSLEIQLPFLQTIFNKFQIIPIILSAQNNKDPELLANVLYQAIGPNDLIVISTDLSHYPIYDDANIIDKETLKAILTLNPGQFISKFQKLKRELPKNTSTLACGERAILTGLYLTDKLNLREARLLHYENSGDRPIGNKEEVVGYGAMSIYSSQEEHFSDTIVLTTEEKKLALRIARQTLKNHFNNKNVKIPIPINSKLNKRLGVFVTLNKQHDLRGCIGNFKPKQPLYQIIEKVTLDAALKDDRFQPVSIDELDDIDIEISVLSPRKKIYTLNDIIPGKHGVYIYKSGKSGTYLPKVAPERF